MTNWRNCQSSIVLVGQINLKWPGRDKASDGTIGNAEHAARTSDHNPWVVVDGIGVVRARDVDKDGIDAAWCVEELRKMGQAGDIRLRNQGYVIFNRRITTPDFRGWNVYTGTNPHDHHFHVSWSVDRAGFDSQEPFAFLGGAPAPSGPPAAPAVQGYPVLQYGMKNSREVASLQRFLNWCNWRPALPLLPVTGNFLDQTKAVVMAAQRQVGFGGNDVDGVVGPQTLQRFIQRGWDLK